MVVGSLGKGAMPGRLSPCEPIRVSGQPQPRPELEMEGKGKERKREGG